MAHIHQEQVTINISKLVKGNHDLCDDAAIFSEELCAALEVVVKELLGDDSLMLEVEHKQGE